MLLCAKINTLPVARIVRFTAVLAIALAAGHLVQTLAALKPAAVAEVEALPTHIVQLTSGDINGRNPVGSGFLTVLRD